MLESDKLIRLGNFIAELEELCDKYDIALQSRETIEIQFTTIPYKVVYLSEINGLMMVQAEEQKKTKQTTSIKRRIGFLRWLLAKGLVFTGGEDITEKIQDELNELNSLPSKDDIEAIQGTQPSWKPPVSTESGLPIAEDEDGVTRFIEDTEKVAVYATKFGWMTKKEG